MVSSASCRRIAPRRSRGKGNGLKPWLTTRVRRLFVYVVVVAVAVDVDVVVAVVVLVVVGAVVADGVRCCTPTISHRYHLVRG